MVQRLALAGFTTTALVASAAFAPSASAGNVAWSVTLGAPGFAVSAGAPDYGPYYPPVAPVPYAGAVLAPPVDYPYAVPYVGAVVRPYYYPHYRPYAYARPWYGAHYAHWH